MRGKRPLPTRKQVAGVHLCWLYARRRCCVEVKGLEGNDALVCEEFSVNKRLSRLSTVYELRLCMDDHKRTCILVEFSQILMN